MLSVAPEVAYLEIEIVVVIAGEQLLEESFHFLMRNYIPRQPLGNYALHTSRTRK
jgi:hypothetical protein